MELNGCPLQNGRNQQPRGTSPRKQYDTIAVDFDGTLCVQCFPEIGEPKQAVINFVKSHAARGTKIILYTCRENGNRRLLDEAIAFCKRNEIPLFAVNENPANPYLNEYGTREGRKVFADLYIDDKAINAADIRGCMEGANDQCRAKRSTHDGRTCCLQRD